MELDPDVVRQLLEVFETELDEQSEIITDGLLKLRQDVGAEVRHGLVDAIFRAAHNIKGAARGVEIAAIAELAHHIESIFSSLRQNDGEVSAEVIQLCFQALDRMRIIMVAVRAGDAAEPDIGDLLPRLTHVAMGNQHEMLQAPERKPAAEIIEEKSAIGVDTIRVAVHKLERASALIEELQVSKMEMDDLQSGMNSLSGRCDRLRVIARAGGLPGGVTDVSHTPEGSFTAVAAELSVLARGMQKDIRLKRRRLQYLLDAVQSEMRNLRMVPVSSMLRPLQRIVWDIAHQLNKRIRLEIVGDEIEMDRVVLEGLRAPIIHLINNAIDHGIELPDARKEKHKPEEGVVTIRVRSEGGRIVITVKDDGAGIDPDKIVQVALRKRLITSEEANKLQPDEILDLIFRPGFSSKEIITDLSGRGVGLDVVRTNVSRLMGQVWLETGQEEGAAFHMRVPLTVATDQGLIVRSCGMKFAIPVSSVLRVMLLDREDVVQVEATQAIIWQGRPVPLRDMADILELEGGFTALPEKVHVVVIAKGARQLALLVEDVIGDSELVIKPLLPPLTHVRNVTGAAFTGSGGIMIVLNAGDMVESAYRPGLAARVLGGEEAEAVAPPQILVVDDSITTRTLERNILESHGYSVTLATDGKEAWDLIRQKSFDLVITDIEMPVMDGFELTERIKQSEKYGHLPVVMVTSLSREKEKQRGVEVGADGYIVKGQFETRVLLDIVHQLI